MSVFKVKDNKGKFITEILAGITTFAAMAYVILVNPAIVAGEAGSDLHTAVFVATCLGSFLGTLLTAFIANLPFAQASGVGLTAVFASVLMGANGYSYPTALLIVLISGILFILATVLGLNKAISKAIPKSMKAAIGAGIGLYIALLGLSNNGNGIIEKGENGFSLIDMGGLFDKAHPESMHTAFSALVILFGVIAISTLRRYRVPGSILIGMALTACAYWFGGVYISKGIAEVVKAEMPSAQVDFSGIGSQFGVWAKNSLGVCLTQGVSELFGKDFAKNIVSIVIVTLCFTLTDIFTSAGTFIGAAQGNNMVDDKGEMPRMKEALLADSIATTVGAVLGAPTVSVGAESSMGIAVGGKTGLSALVTALCFAAALFLSPFLGYIPSVATAAALICVGIIMMSSLKSVDFGDLTEAVPAILTMALMPVTGSIIDGIAIGIIAHLVIKVFSLKFREFSIAEIVIAALFAAMLIFR